MRLRVNVFCSRPIFISSFFVLGKGVNGDDHATDATHRLGKIITVKENSNYSHVTDNELYFCGGVCSLYYRL
jgi:hypothetical protein